MVRHCRSAILVGLFAVLMVPLLAGCRAEEQNRITMYEPGVFLGKKKSGLSQDQLRVLHRRARGQAGSIKPTGGGGTNISGKGLDTRLLGQRTENQENS